MVDAVARSLSDQEISYLDRDRGRRAAVSKHYVILRAACMLTNKMARS